MAGKMHGLASVAKQGNPLKAGLCMKQVALPILTLQFSSDERLRSGPPTAQSAATTGAALFGASWLRTELGADVEEASGSHWRCVDAGVQVCCQAEVSYPSTGQVPPDSVKNWWDDVAVDWGLRDGLGLDVCFRVRVVDLPRK